MTHQCSNRNSALAVCSWLLISIAGAAALNGCAAFHPVEGIPVERVPAEFRAVPRSGMVPIDLSRLRQTPPIEYRVDAGDLLGIFVEGILGNPGEMPPVTIPNNAELPPALGFPVLIQDDGTISLPGCPDLLVRGMTLREVRERIRHAYTVENPLLQTGPDKTEAHILVNLQRKRTYRVLVVRQESDTTTNGTGAPSQIDLNVVRRGTGQVVQLPAFENDVLHALTQTGGLPSSQAENAVYIIRRRPQILEPTPVPAYAPQPPQPRGLQVPPAPAVSGFAPAAEPLTRVGHSTDGRYQTAPAVRPAPVPQLPIPSDPVGNPYGTYRDSLPQAANPSSGIVHHPGYTFRGQSPMMMESSMPGAMFWEADGFDSPAIIRIPMRVYPGESLPFTEADIILQDGDIVFVESRETEFFFTGGLLGGGQYVLPQNYDLDLLEALSIVQSQVNTSFNSNTRAIGGVSALNHDVTVGASKMIILRKAPTGCEIKIEVDLYDALRDPRERILIKPGDYVMLQYTRTEAIAAFFERHILEGAVVGAASSLVFGN